MNIVAVGIDASKGKSMVVAVRHPMEIVVAPYEIRHTARGMQNFVELLKTIDGELRVVLESTGHYHIPVVNALFEAGIFVSLQNPRLIKNFANISLRNVKTDKQDAITLARFGLKYWDELRMFTPIDTMRMQLRTCSRQYDLYMRMKVMLKTNLVALVDRTYPGANNFFLSPAKPDGHQKWVDFVADFWHCEYVGDMGESAFIDTYSEWCKQNKYTFKEKQAVCVYENSLGHAPSWQKNDHVEMIVRDSVKRLTNISQGVEIYRTEMTRLARQLPEYYTVMGLSGVGKTLGAQLMAEIGDVRKFTHGKALVAFAGIDPGNDQSGKHSTVSVTISRNGRTGLRKTLYNVIVRNIRYKPKNEPVYDFYLKKRDEGKKYHVCIVAAANKFLRIYYARVKEHLDNLDNEELI